MELEDIPFKGAKVITCVPIEQNNFIAGSRPVKTTKVKLCNKYRNSTLIA